MNALTAAQNALGLVHAGRPAEAESLLRDALAQGLDGPELRIVLCVALHRAGRTGELPVHAAAAIDAMRPDPPLVRQFAVMLIAAGHADLAERAAAKLSGLLPGDPESWSLLAECQYSADRYVPAAASARSGLAIAPGNADLTHWLALSLRESGQVEAAVGALRAHQSLRPDDFNIASRICYAMCSLHTATPDATLEAHRAYGRILGRLRSGPSPFRVAARRTGGPVRLAVVSADLRAHSVGSFIGPVLERVDRALVRVACFSTAPRGEALERFRRAADHWHDGSLDDPVSLGRAISGEGTQMVLELGGHTMGCVLPLLAFRVAPVQATYLGYPNTTGTPNIDYRIVDAITDPPDAERWCTERLWRLPGCFLCYEPAALGPLPEVRAARTDRAPAFGSFNALRKISPATLDAWAAVLRDCPGWDLRLKAAGLADRSTAGRLIDELARRGVEPGRVRCLGWVGGRDAHLRSYDDVDVALDTFPYNGTTTTCEALVMGVPVVTFVGGTHAGRVGASLLAAAGLPELCAPDAAGYAALAVALANDADRRARYRAELRHRVLSSPLCDADGFARRFERAIVEMATATPPA
ncbi:MAG: hypothetical protein JNJ48_02860 [Phycisphaerae bacterium]|nr:hypothetical protein [Phycisphaerae bacterium]